MNDPKNGVDYLIDYYAVLGIGREADSEVIKRAHRELQKKYHPDRYESLAQEFQGQAAAKSRIIQEAYEILSDPAKKSAYDKQFADWSGPISTDGYPVIDLSCPNFSPLPLITGVQNDPPLNLSQFSGYNDTTFALIEAMYCQTENPSPEIVAAYKEQLAKKDLHLALQEEAAWRKAGFYNQPIQERPSTAYKDETEERLNEASQTVVQNVSRVLLGLQAGEIKLLVAGDSGAEQALVIHSPEAMAEYLKTAEERFRITAEEVRTLAIARSELAQKKLKMVRIEYRPEQFTFFPQLALCVMSGEKRVWFMLQRQDESISVTPKTGEWDAKEDLGEDLGDPAIAAQWIARGWNVAFLELQDDVNLREQVEWAAILHFEKLLK